MIYEYFSHHYKSNKINNNLDHTPNTIFYIIY
jgi:hypothetical protein